MDCACARGIRVVSGEYAGLESPIVAVIQIATACQLCLCCQAGALNQGCIRETCDGGDDMSGRDTEEG